MNLKLILTLVVCIVIGIVICLALGYFNIAPFDQFYSMVLGYVGNFNIGEALSNPTTLIAGVGTAITAASAVAVPLMNKANEAKKQAESAINTAKTELGSVKDSLTETTGKLETANLNLESATKALGEKDALINTLKTKVETLQPQLDKLQTSYTELQKIKAADVIGSLPGGTVINNPDGSKTAVIEKQVVI